jgi:hypothetical protein
VIIPKRAELIHDVGNDEEMNPYFVAKIGA